MIALPDCIPGGFYEIFSRNLPFGVFCKQGNSYGFIGIRHKFGERFLDFETHWDWGNGTVQPVKYIGQCPISTDWHDEEVNKVLFKWIDEAQGPGSFATHRGEMVQGHKIKVALNMDGPTDFEKRQKDKKPKWFKATFTIERWLHDYVKWENGQPITNREAVVYKSGEKTFWAITRGNDGYFYVSLWTVYPHAQFWKDYVATFTLQEAREFLTNREAKEIPFNPMQEFRDLFIIRALLKR